MKVKAKIVSALACGLKVLEDDFEELEIVKQEGGMIKAHHFSLFYFLPLSFSLCLSEDSEDEDDESYLPGSADPILEPRDTYSLRPLPLRIGTPAFLQEDDVGLGEYASDSEGDANTNIHQEAIFSLHFHR